MINIERKTVRSISELSSFKFLLIFYLIFFILSLIIIGIVALLAWAGLASSGISIPGIFQSLGLGNFGLASIGGGSVLYIVLSIVGGLIASVFYAAFGTLMVWIVNVVLRISGGIELRFIDREVKVKSK